MLKSLGKIFSDVKLKAKASQQKFEPGELDGPVMVFTLLFMISAAAVPAVIYPFYVQGTSKPSESWGIMNPERGGRGGGSMWGNTDNSTPEEFKAIFEDDDDDED
eukprot:TRINITY_DN7106_c0_g1_i2.p3 TRINITY_DN7106_c0_g1~~TRINITY_DN7106_c0_g1_i2.p3  ORF type:complete len:105 (-),score=28.17 TRINITY_DN7106_c0_g1_i2:447-761(-)